MEVSSLKELSIAFVFYSLLSLLALYLAKRWKIFAPKQRDFITIQFRDILLVIAVIIVITLATGLVFNKANPSLAVLILLLGSLVKVPIFYKIFGNRWKACFSNFFKEFGLGILMWGIAIPYVALVNVTLRLIYKLIGFSVHTEQAVLTLFKALCQQPWHYIMMSLLIIVIVPLLEELVFRGIAQTWLVSKLGKLWGMLLAVLLFTFAHFTKSQGLGNIEILTTLLVISFFLSFAYMRRKSLANTFGLHFMFNLMGILLLWLLDK